MRVWGDGGQELGREKGGGFEHQKGDWGKRKLASGMHSPNT